VHALSCALSLKQFSLLPSRHPPLTILHGGALLDVINVFTRYDILAPVGRKRNNIFLSEAVMWA